MHFELIRHPFWIGAIFKLDGRRDALAGILEENQPIGNDVGAGSEIYPGFRPHARRPASVRAGLVEIMPECEALPVFVGADPSIKGNTPIHIGNAVPEVIGELNASRGIQNVGNVAPLDLGED